MKGKVGWETGYKYQRDDTLGVSGRVALRLRSDLIIPREGGYEVEDRGLGAGGVHCKKNK